VRLSFELRDLAGAVDVVVERNVDPERLGSWPGAAGFPACTAEVSYAAQREVAAILGFAWGFAIRGETITIARPAPLAPREWDGHLPLLRSRHPDWRFAAGYQER
jgi:hypothetical protein